MSQTIEQLYDRCIKLTGNIYQLPVNNNKGLVGLFLEDLLDIPHTSNLLDAIDGEVKTFPLKRLRNGTFVPKETMFITSLDKNSILNTGFLESKCYKKISKMLVVPYYREGDAIQYMQPRIINESSVDYADLYSVIENDYNSIRTKYIETNTFDGRDGAILQNRPKGPGHGSTSRAFYLRKQFMKRLLTLD